MANWLKRNFLKRKIDNYIRNKVNEELENNFKNYQLSYEWKNALFNKILFLDKSIGSELKIRCYLDSMISKLIFIEKFEQKELIFLHNFLRPGDVFIDIGANIGLHTLIASKKVEANGKVYAFEPTPNTFARLKENIYINNIQNVEIFPIALSNTSGSQPFFSFGNGMDAFNSFAPILEQTPFEKVDVATTTLSNFYSKLPVGLIEKISLIKIDVEGWEAPVLEGGYKLLEKPNAPTLLVEFTEENAKAAGRKCSDLFSLGEELGYKWYHIENNKIIESRKKKYFPYQNLIASKDKFALLDRIQIQ